MGERASVLVAVAGFSGLCMAIKLKPSGADSCFPVPHPDGSRRFVPLLGVRAGLRLVAEKDGILPHIRHDANAVSSRFDEGTSTWVVPGITFPFLPGRQRLQAG